MLTGPPRSDGTTRTGAPRPSVAIRRAEGNVVISVHGQLTADGDGGIEHVLHDLIWDQGNLHLVIDVEGVTDVDPAGLGVLHDAWRLARQRGATLTLRNPPEPIRDALEAWADGPSHGTGTGHRPLS